MKYIVNIIMIFTTLLFTACADAGDDQTVTVFVSPNEVTHNPPVAKITVSSSEINFGESVTLSAMKSSDVDGNIVSYAWLNENNTTLSENKEFSYKFSTAGEHTITLKVTDNEGLVGTTTQTIMVKAVLTSVTLELSNTILKINDTTQAKVTAHYNDNSSKELTNTITWIISNKAVVSIDDKLEVKALSSGTSTIQAKVAEMSSLAVSLEVLSTDTTPPVITLNGDANLTLTQGQAYNELGATAFDAVDGNVSVSISGSVDTVTVGNYTLTYTATDNSTNSVSVQRVVNIIAQFNHIKSLTLTAPQTHFVRKKDTFYKQYIPIRSSIKVMATYEDGNNEEVTDRVEWIGVSDGIVLDSDYFRAEKGIYTLKSSLHGITSNLITIDVKDDTSLVQYEVTYPEKNNLIYMAVTLLNKPTDDVKLTLTLRAEDKVGFAYHVNNEMKQSYTMTFRVQEWDKGGNTQDVQLTMHDKTLLDDIVVITEPLVSDDVNYSNKNPKDITLKRKPALILDAPSLQSTKGAVRGVSIKFRITTGNQSWSKVTLVNPPIGMKVLGETFIENTELYGIDVQWDVPMDVVEGKIYNITAKATDPRGREKTITFPIKVPKTKPIQTKLLNNELIVIDKSSNLYGMKMKGHSGEDISNVKLRSINYEDVWKKSVENKKPEDVVERIVFVMDNMPEALDVKFPEWVDSEEEAILLDTEIYKYTENNRFWYYATMTAYTYENTNGLVLYHQVQKKYSNNNSNIFMLVFQKYQNRR